MPEIKPPKAEGLKNSEDIRIVKGVKYLSWEGLVRQQYEKEAGNS